jgi:hypothetical protein
MATLYFKILAIKEAPKKMVTKRYVKKAYVLEAFCDKCGSKMVSTGMVYSTYPEQYPFRCSNSECDGRATF